MTRAEFLARIERIVAGHGYSLDALLGRRTVREVLEQMVPAWPAAFSDAKARMIAANVVGYLDWLNRPKRLLPRHS